MSALHHHGREDGAASMMSPKPNGMAMAQLSQLLFATLDGSPLPRVRGGGRVLLLQDRHRVGRRRQTVSWRGGMSTPATSATSRSPRRPTGGARFAAPTRVSDDRWTIDGCPEDGPTIAADGRGSVHVVWPTVLSEHGEPGKALFHAMSRDGRTFSTRERIPTVDVPRHPQLAIGRDGAVVVVWDEAGKRHAPDRLPHMAWLMKADTSGFNGNRGAHRNPACIPRLPRPAMVCSPPGRRAHPPHP